MAYVVRITTRAERDLAHLFDQIDGANSDAALEWYLGLIEAISSLEHRPNRCPVTPEKPNLRHLLYGHKPNVYRILYRVLESRKQVEVIHIRHGARKAFSG